MIKKIDDVYGNLKITWIKVLIMALACGLLTGVLMLIPQLKGTSFQNIGVCMEAWIALALVIILDSEKPLEASLKTFAFFLISQPLIYLVQVPFAALGWQLFMYYKRWFIITLLTLPGAFIAWYTRKGNLLSVLILAVADGILMFMEVPMHLTTLKLYFPHQILALIFIFASSCYYTLHLIKDKKLRIVSFALKLVFLAAGLMYY